MKLAVFRSHTSLLLAGSMLLLGGIAWGATSRSHAKVSHPKAAVSIGPARTATTPVAKAVARPHKAATKTHAKASPAAGNAAMRAFLDPETGTIGPPTTENLPPAEAVVSRDGSDLTVVTLPNGTRMIDLKGRFDESMVMKIDAKGKRTVECVSDPKAAYQQSLKTAVQVPALPAPAAAPAPAQPQREDR
jgi:hypothetical protein